MKQHTTYITIKHTTILKPEINDILNLRQSIAAKLMGYQSEPPLIFKEGDVEVKYVPAVFSKLWFKLNYLLLLGWFKKTFFSTTVALKLKKIETKEERITEGDKENVNNI